MKWKIFGVFVAIAVLNTCNSYDHVDANSFYHSLYDYVNAMEANIRVQYNTLNGERFRAISTQLNILKTLQSGMPTDMGKYADFGITEGIDIYQSMNELINSVRYNGLFAAKSALDDMKNDHLSLLYNFVMSHVDLVDQISFKSKNFFVNGKMCVIAMEKDLQTHFETTAKKYMDCLKNTFLTYNLQPSSFKNYQPNLTTTFALLTYNIKLPFFTVGSYSSRSTNETAAINFNTVKNFIFFV